MKFKDNTLKMNIVGIGFMILLVVGWNMRCDKFNAAVEDQISDDEYEMTEVDDLAAHILADSIISDNVFKTTNAAEYDTLQIYYSVLSIDSHIDTVESQNIMVFIDTLIAWQYLTLDTTLKEYTLTIGSLTETVSEDSTFLLFSTLTTNGYLTEYRKDFHVIQTASQTDSIPYPNYSAVIDTLLERKFVLTVEDTAYHLITNSLSDMSGFVLTTGVDQDFVFYFTDYVLLEIYDATGQIIEAQSNNIPLELIAGCFKIESEKPAPIVKARYTYKLMASTNYLFVIIKNDQTTDDTFNCAILSE
ncbi:MAG: hypothetical protein V1681_00140 [Candidatus Neomarinimicrobiota bacterium]